MSTQPGWYASPGEEGTLRYWGGEAWTEYRQPAPAPTLPTASDPAPVPLPAQHAELADPSTAPTRFHLDTAVGLGFAVDGIALGGPSQLTELGAVADRLRSAARQAGADARLQPRATGIRGAVKAMVVGLVVIALGVALVLFFSAQHAVGAGEASTQGTVVADPGIGSGCNPVVQFQVASRTYQASEGTGGSCKSDAAGDSVTVIYSIANPSQGARYVFPNPLESFDLLVPLLGVVILISGLFTFVARLFRRRSEVAQSRSAP